MLVMSRKVGESLYLPELGIEFKVLEIRPYSIRLGVEAPKHIAILRDDTRDTRGVRLEVGDGYVPSNCQRCCTAAGDAANGVCAADPTAVSSGEAARHVGVAGEAGSVCD